MKMVAPLLDAQQKAEIFKYSQSQLVLIKSKQKMTRKANYTTVNIDFN